MKYMFLLPVLAFAACNSTSEQDQYVSLSTKLNDTCFSNRSVNSEIAVNVKFYNNSDRTLEAIWIDFQGNQVSYGKARTSHEKRQITYISHPWAFVDPTTGDCVGYYLPKIEDNGKQINMVE